MAMSMLSEKHSLRRSLGLCLLLSVVALGLLGAKIRPETTPDYAPTKIGIVNIQEAIIVTNEGKKAFAALQQRFAPKQNDLKTLNDEVENMKKDLQVRGNTLNADDRAKLAQNLEVKQKTLKRNYDDTAYEIQQAEQEVTTRIGGKMLDVMERYAKNNGYTLILDVSNEHTPVLWASSDTSITKNLVDAYNVEFPTPR